MPNFDYKDGSHESTKESYLKPNIINESLNGKLFRRATIFPSPMRTVENLKINIESFPEKVIPMKGSEIQEESVSIQENSNTAQNQNNELLTMRYDSVMNKTHKKVGKVQFQSIHENPSEKLVLPPVHSAEELTESLKIPKLVKNILEKKMKLNPDLEKCEDDDIKIEIAKIDNMTRVQSYFENEHRRQNLSIDFKSIDRFDQEAIKEYRNLQKIKALQLMKKLNTKFSV